MIFIIILNYESSKVKKAVALVSIVIFFSTADFLNSTLHNIGQDTHQTAVDHPYLNVFYNFVLGGLLPFMLASLLRRFRHINKAQFPLSVIWVYVFVIPVSYLVIYSLPLTVDLQFITMVSVILLVVVVNALLFYFHNIFAISYEDKLKTALFAQEKEYYYTQSQLMQESVDKVKAIRHDMKIHLATLRDYATGNKEVTDYLTRLLGDIGESEAYSSTGNIAVDSIINYKLRDVEDDDVKLDVKVAVPPDLQVEAADIVTILGNLLDNALEAIAKVPDNKLLKLNVKFDGSGLLIRVDNTFNREVKYLGATKQIATIKTEDGHGYGLINIRQAAEKYKGYVKISHEGDVFSVLVFLYVV